MPHGQNSNGSYPLEVRLKRDGILVSQGLTVHLVGHNPSSDEPLSKSLIVVVEVENQVWNQHVIWAIPSRRPLQNKLSIGKGSGNIKQAQKNLRPH